MIPTVVGPIINTAQAISTASDPNPANNIGTAVTTVLSPIPGQEIVNDLVTFDSVGTTFRTTADPTGCPAGFVGKFSFNAELTNFSNNFLSGLQMVVVTLTNGNLLQNADGGPRGVGAILTVPPAGDFLDGILSPDESVDVPFVICLQQREPFMFFVNVLGKAQ